MWIIRQRAWPYVGWNNSLNEMKNYERPCVPFGINVKSEDVIIIQRQLKKDVFQYALIEP